MIFINPYFLFGLFALSIPIIVHLFNFRKYKIFYFSNTQFLQSLQQQTKRQSQLKKLLILALRLLAITAIVFAFARPYIPLEKAAANLKGNNYIVVYVDNSFSMEGLASRGSLLDEAREKALSIAEAYAEDDQFMILTNDFEPKHNQFFSKEEFKKEVNGIRISSITRTMDAVVQYAQSNLEEQNTQNKKLYIISDFQRTTSTIDKLGNLPDVYVFMVPLKANKTNNVYIDSLWFDSPVFNVGQSISLHVMLKNISDVSVEKLPVKLFVNGNQKAIASADLQADGTGEVKMNFSLQETGIQQAYLVINDYPITFDDKLFFSFYLRPYNSILNVYGEKESPYLNALFAADSSIRYQAVSDRNIDYAQLKQQDLIVLDQVKEQSSGFVQAMESYVREGGNVLFIPSVDKELVMRNVFNQHLHIPKYESLDTHSSRIASLNIDNDLFKNIFEKQNENMNLPAVYRYYRLDNVVYPNKERLLVMENDGEFLSLLTLDNGKLYLLAVPLDDAYSEFHKHAIFVPALFNMAILKAKQEEAYYIIGSDMRIALPAYELQGDNVLEIARPGSNFSFIPEIRRQFGGLSLFVHDQIKEAGNYTVKDKEEVFYGLSFNYNRKESDMRCYDKAELKDKIETLGLKNYIVLSLQNKSTNAVVSEIQAAGIQLWQYCILLALLFLLAEVILLRIWKP